MVHTLRARILDPLHADCSRLGLPWGAPFQTRCAPPAAVHGDGAVPAPGGDKDNKDARGPVTTLWAWRRLGEAPRLAREDLSMEAWEPAAAEPLGGARGAGPSRT